MQLAAEVDDVRRVFSQVRVLAGNVMPSAGSLDLGDARGTHTKVFPPDEDESFYFVFEPLLPDSKDTFKVKYVCEPVKQSAISVKRCSPRTANLRSDPRHECSTSGAFPFFLSVSQARALHALSVDVPELIRPNVEPLCLLSLLPSPPTTMGLLFSDN